MRNDMDAVNRLKEEVNRVSSHRFNIEQDLKKRNEELRNELHQAQRKRVDDLTDSLKK